MARFLRSHRDPLFSFAVIADTHMRPEKGDNSSPWAVNKLANGRARYVVQQVNRLNPDFVIHLGDIVHPVPVLPTYGPAARVANRELKKLNAPLHMIPGNHDVGDKPNPSMPAASVSDFGLKLYRKHFGRDYYSFDYQDCHFTFINAQILNSGLRSERAQEQWLTKDLAANKGKRVFLFTHYPPYIMANDEAWNYDNIDEPKRSWLLSLIRKNRIEALFAGHVHNFFYNVEGRTECYLLPATSFFRQDYSELFRIEAAPEHGRNDADKLGFFMVDVYPNTHVPRIYRTAGRSLGKAQKLPAAKPKVRSRHTKEAVVSPLGVHVRHPWAEITEFPYNGPMDEFERKRVRNDYTLMALWELGIRKIRTPVSDLMDDDRRKRMSALKAIGHRFTLFSFGVPDKKVLSILQKNRTLVDSYEVILPWQDSQKSIPALQALKKKTGIRVNIANIESSAHKESEGSKFSHFVSYGFQAPEVDLVDGFLRRRGARQAADGFVFRVGLGGSVWDAVQEFGKIAAEREVDAVVNIRLASESPATYNTDDAEIANRVAEAMIAAAGTPNIEVFLDTFMDLDRGYFPRHGLFDRRFNPRPASFVFRHLVGVLNEHPGKITLVPSWREGSMQARPFLTKKHFCVLYLPKSGKTAKVKSAVAAAQVTGQQGDAQFINLETGEITLIPWRESKSGKGIGLQRVASVKSPSLLIIDR
jgi:3',5'-cyclic AMP phosphodiesterase CpdA